MKNISANFLKDGDRTIVIITGPSEQQDELAYRIMQAYMLDQKKTEEKLAEYPGETSSEKIEHVEDLLPVTETAVSVPTEKELSEAEPFDKYRARHKDLIKDPKNRFYGKTAVEVLKVHGFRAIPDLFSYSSSLPNGPERTAIADECKKYLKKCPEIVAEMTRRTVKCDFLTAMQPLYPSMNLHSGYSSLEDFKKHCSDDELDAAIKTLAIAVQKRVS